MTERTFVVSDGLGRAVFENKYSRKKPDGSFETWEEVARRVVNGNWSLLGLLPRPGSSDYRDWQTTHDLARAGVMIFAGRHLQHGDAQQREHIGELYTNCSTAMTSFLKFWLLLKGSGVGREYSDDLCLVDWSNMPETAFVLDRAHPDWEPWIETSDEARHKYPSESKHTRWFRVVDSAEGWTKVVEALETAAFHEHHKDKLFVFDFSDVRPRGSPIRGQQGRPSSGPTTLIAALHRVRTIRGIGMSPWKQAMFVDHYLADCVALGGIRRAARIAFKSWRDREVFDFIGIKRGGWLWSANNSVLVDAQFWEEAKDPRTHAARVFQAATGAAWLDRTGEPGFLSVDRLHDDPTGIDDITPANLLSDRFRKLLDVHPATDRMLEQMLRIVKRRRYSMITNPCAEIPLHIAGGYCCLGDVCLANCETIEEAFDGVRQTVKFLLRVNRMDFMYAAEVTRTNRIGVSLAGVHEFAWKMFGCRTWDLVHAWDEDCRSSDAPALRFWAFLDDLREEAEQVASSYAGWLDVAVPHTVTCIKPGGTVPKVADCTEGINLPAYSRYLRNVQYNDGDAEVEDLRRRGYPVRKLEGKYLGRTIVGFPTRTRMSRMAGGEETLAGDLTVAEHYQWLRLFEQHWLGKGNGQLSYTLKFDPDSMTYEQFAALLMENQPTVRNCATMPQLDVSAHEYQPEEPLTREEYDALVARIDRCAKESYDDSRMGCESGACAYEPDRP